LKRIRIDPAGVPFVAGALALALLSAAFSWALALPFFVLGLLFLFFFRDPDRAPTTRAGAVIAPADGRVLVAGAATPEAAPPGQWQQVSIFLSPLDVHVNRVPISGRVTRVAYSPGRFLPAYRPEAAHTNERCEIWIDHDGQPVVARQLVGILARRVVCRVKQGVTVQAGERYGVMKFGSRMDVFVPTTAEICVSVHDRVRGGETVIAVLH